MSKLYQKSKKTHQHNLHSNYIAFVAGHFDQAKLTEKILFKKVREFIPGVSSVRIPSKFWKGFGFIHFENNSYLK